MELTSRRSLEILAVAVLDISSLCLRVLNKMGSDLIFTKFPNKCVELASAKTSPQPHPLKTSPTSPNVDTSTSLCLYRIRTQPQLSSQTKRKGEKRLYLQYVVNGKVRYLGERKKGFSEVVLRIHTSSIPISIEGEKTVLSPPSSIDTIYGSITSESFCFGWSSSSPDARTH